MSTTDEIREILTRYCQGVDRKQYDLLRSCYHDDAFDSHGPYQGDADGFVAWVQNRHRNVKSSMHFVGNVSIKTDGNRARVETYCLTYQNVAAGGDDPFGGGEETWLTIAARYVDTFEHRPDTGWKILLRNVVYEWIRREDPNAYVKLDPSWNIAKRDASDLLFAPMEKTMEGAPWDS